MAAEAGMFPVPLPVIINQEAQAAMADSQNTERTADAVESLAEKQEELGSQTVIYLKNLYKTTKDDLALPNSLKKLQEKVIKRNFKDFVQNKYFTKSLKLMSDTLKALGKTMLDLILGLLMFAFFDPNGTLLASLISLFANLLVMIINIIGSLFPKLINIVIAVLPVLISAIRSVIQSIINALPMVIEALIGLVPVLMQAVISLLPVIITGIATALETAMNAIEKHFPWLKPVFDVLRKITSTVKEFFKDGKGLSTIFEKLQEVFALLTPIIQKIFSGIIGPLLSIIWTLVSAIFPLLGPLFGLIFTVVSAVVDILADILVPILGVLAGVIADYVVPVVEWLITGLTVLIPVIKWIVIVLGTLFLIGKVVGIIMALIVAWPVLLVIAIIVFIGLIYKYRDVIIEALLGLWESVVKGFWSFVDMLWSGIKFLGMVMLGFLAILLWPITLIVMIVKNWKKLSEMMKKYLTIAMKALIGILEKAASFIKSIPGKIITYLGNAAANIGTSISNALSNLNFSSAVGGLLTAIQNIWQSLENWLKNTRIGKLIFGEGGGVAIGEQGRLAHAAVRAIAGAEATDADKNKFVEAVKRVREGKSEAAILNEFRGSKIDTDAERSMALQVARQIAASIPTGSDVTDAVLQNVKLTSQLVDILSRAGTGSGTSEADIKIAFDHGTGN